MATEHVTSTYECLESFIDALVLHMTEDDHTRDRLRGCILGTLEIMKRDAEAELSELWEDEAQQPVTYNHYYTDTIKKRRRERSEKSLVSCIDNTTQHVILPRCKSNHTSVQVDAEKAAREYTDEVDPDMENHSCEEALDCLYSIYKVSELVHPPDRLPLTHSA